MSHRNFFFKKSMGSVGMIAYPFALFFQFLSPIILVFAYLYFFVFFYLDLISSYIFFLFIFLAIFLGSLISIISIILDRIIFKVEMNKSSFNILLIGAIIENIGYKQLNLIWRFIALIKFIKDSKLKWGKINRVSELDSK